MWKRLQCSISEVLINFLYFVHQLSIVTVTTIKHKAWAISLCGFIHGKSAEKVIFKKCKQILFRHADFSAPHNKVLCSVLPRVHFQNAFNFSVCCINVTTKWLFVVANTNVVTLNQVAECQAGWHSFEFDMKRSHNFITLLELLPVKTIFISYPQQQFRQNLNMPIMKQL